MSIFSEHVARFARCLQRLRPVALLLFFACVDSWAQVPKRTGLPVELVTAMTRMLLVQPQGSPFHVKLKFSATSDTGSRSEGTFTENWWSERWWTQTVVVNGESLESRNLNGKTVRKQDDAFLLPFAARRILDEALDPFPDHPTKKPADAVSIQAGNTLLRCFTIAAGSNPTVGMPAGQKSFCLDPAGNLRLTDSTGYRMVYNQIAAFGNRSIAHDVRMMRGGARVADLQVVELDANPAGLQALQDTGSNEQLEFATSLIHPLLELTPRQMQHQMISTDVSMIPAPTDWPLKRGQRFATVRVLQKRGRLLDAEILNCSDAAARELALRVLKHVSFSEHRLGDQPLTLEGVVMLVVPQT